MFFSGPDRWLRRLLIFTGLWLLVGFAQACQTPVFRYALERWKPSVYPLLLFTRGPLTPAQEACLDPLRRLAETQKLANVAVRVVDLHQAMPPGVEQVWKTQTNATLPWMVLRYPDTEADGASAWAGPLTAENISRLLDSPLRRGIYQALADGHAAAWLLLESGDRAADERMWRLLETELKKAHRTIELAADPDNPSTNALHLPVTFKILRSPRQAPEEELFIHSMLSVEPELLARPAPVVVPVFGRGRALCALPAAQVTPETLKETTDFITGACSCEVKELNPGLDLLMTANWEEALGGRRLSDPPPAALVGLGSLEEKPASPPPAAAPAALTAPAPSAPAQGGSPLGKALLWFSAGLVGVLAAATWLVTRAHR